MDGLINGKVLDEIEIAQDISAHRVDQEQRRPITRCTQRDNGIERPCWSTRRDQTGEVGGSRRGHEGVQRNLDIPGSRDRQRHAHGSDRCAAGFEEVGVGSKSGGTRELGHDVSNRSLVCVQRCDVG